jgi:signal transduction histidine kinase
VKDLDGETRTLALDSIEQSANTQVMLVSDMLDASRIVLGKLHVERQPFVVQEVVREAMAVIRPAARREHQRAQRGAQSRIDVHRAPAGSARGGAPPSGYAARP